ncbi:helix-turn-helix transcriptional regulator, partial [Kitasatospora nipponensis]
DEVARAYTRLGATSDAAHCQQTLRELGLARPAPRGRRGYGDQLSPRESEVAALLRKGASNQQIAEALFLSPRTVEHHVANALRKLGAPTREALHGTPAPPTQTPGPAATSAATSAATEPAAPPGEPPRPAPKGPRRPRRP